MNKEAIYKGPIKVRDISRQPLNSKAVSFDNSKYIFD